MSCTRNELGSVPVCTSPSITNERTNPNPKSELTLKVVTVINFNFNGGCFEDSAWSFNRLEDWTALFTFINLLLHMFIFSLTAARVQGDSCPTSLPRMAGQSTSYRSFMPASNTPTCDFKILMTLRTCCTPSDLGYRVSVVLFCVILLTLTPRRHSACDLRLLLLQHN